MVHSLEPLFRIVRNLSLSHPGIPMWLRNYAVGASIKDKDSKMVEKTTKQKRLPEYS